MLQHPAPSPLRWSWNRCAVCPSRLRSGNGRRSNGNGKVKSHKINTRSWMRLQVTVKPVSVLVSPPPSNSLSSSIVRRRWNRCTLTLTLTHNANNYNDQIENCVCTVSQFSSPFRRHRRRCVWRLSFCGWRALHPAICVMWWCVCWLFIYAFLEQTKESPNERTNQMQMIIYSLIISISLPLAGGSGRFGEDVCDHLHTIIMSSRNKYITNHKCN